MEAVVGSPGRPGLADGPAEEATLTSVGNICINSRGSVFFYDGKRYGQCLRKLEGGVVSTITRMLRSGKHVDGPIDQARFNFINLGGLNSIGENDDVLYLADHWNHVMRRIDLKAGEVTTVAGMRRPKKGDPLAKRYNKGTDGPALTHASFNSGCTFAVYDGVHKAVWCGGPDEGRLRWLRDGQVRTVMGSRKGKWDLNGMGNPAKESARSPTAQERSHGRPGGTTPMGDAGRRTSTPPERPKRSSMLSRPPNDEASTTLSYPRRPPRPSGNSSNRSRPGGGTAARSPRRGTRRSATIRYSPTSATSRSRRSPTTPSKTGSKH